jgi:hypothetical protein
VSSLSWSGVRPWMVRAVLLFAAWRGLSSESEVVSTLSTYAFFALLPSFGQLLRRTKRVAPVHLAGDTRIVLQEAAWRDWVKVKRVLYDDLDIGYPTSRTMFRDLPVTLGPAVPRSHAESVVVKLKKAGALASVVTVDHEESLN